MSRTIPGLITYLSRRCQLWMAECMAPFGLTAAEQPFFMAINAQNGAGLTQEQLTELVCVDKAATARAVSSLEKKGLLIRTKNKLDRRENLVYATDAARAMYPAVRRALLDFDEIMLREIPRDQREQIQRMLLKMDENLNSEDWRAER